MLTADKIQALLSRVKTFARTDDVEILVGGGNSALTRFANNTITQNVAEENYVVSVRTAFGQRTARATTNKLDDESLRRAVQASEAIARVQQPNPHVLPMATAPEAAATSRSPDSHTNHTPSRHFDHTAAVTPQDRAEAVRQMVEVAKKQNLTAAGIYSSSETLEAIANSRGVFAFHRQTSAEVSITMLAGDSSGWQKANSPDVRNLHPAALAEIAAQKTRASGHPRELGPGKYTVILEPAAVLDLVGFMFWDWGGLAILDQRSFLTNRVGAQLFGSNINIVDNVDHPLQSGAPFDGEGVRRQRVHLVENGVVRPLDPRVKLPEHSRVIIVATEPT